MEVKEVLHRRRTPLHFEPDAVVLTRESLESLILDACNAPSEDGLTAWRFLVVRDRAQRESLFECCYRDPRVREASAAIVVCGDTRAWEQALTGLNQCVAQGEISVLEYQRLAERWKRAFEGKPWARAMLALRGPSMVAMNLMLLATERGIATAPIFWFNEDMLREYFHIPEWVIPILVIALGLASTEHPQVEEHLIINVPTEIIYHEDMGFG